MNTARVELSEANAFVEKVHRHHKPATGHRFSVAAARRGQVVGVAICGRPVARGIPQREILEVLRCATDGTRNACSYLYGKAARIASELGFRGVITYTLADDESGASLRACGWWPEVLDERDTHWTCQSRPRAKTKGQGLGRKVRWLWLTGVEEVVT